jgi:hypothetical protein
MNDWELIDITRALHVVPRGDLREHDINKSCWCRPTDEGDVVVHNAMDEREKYETGERKLA